MVLLSPGFASPRRPRLPSFTPGFRKLRSAVLVIWLLMILVYWLTRDVGGRLPEILSPGFASPTTKTPRSFWSSAFTVLEGVKPKSRPVRPKGSAPIENWSPQVSHARVDLTKLTGHDIGALKASHDAFMRVVPDLARQMEYARKTVGIVTTAGVHNFGLVVTQILATRQAGSKLPVEVILDSTQPWIDKICREKLIHLDVQCRDLRALWANMPDVRFVPQLEKFQWKSVALVVASFQKILFMDADTFAVRNPDGIFAPGAEPFTSTGMITWPDFWTPSASPLFYKIASDMKPPALTERTSSESGVMVVDKARHAETLMLSLYYNYYGPKYYYPLLCQGGAGQGDKETFLHAALVLQDMRERGKRIGPGMHATPELDKKKWTHWDVKTMPLVHGRVVNETWKGLFMQQMDPMEDYRGVMGIAPKAGMVAGWGRTNAGPKVGRAAQRKPKPKPREPMAVERRGPGQTKPETPFPDLKKAPYMFFHHNGAKLDFTTLGKKNKDSLLLTARNESGHYVRLWGDPSWIIELTGRDVEKELWKEATRLFCDVNLEDVCQRMQEFSLSVY